MQTFLSYCGIVLSFSLLVERRIVLVHSRRRSLLVFSFPWTPSIANFEQKTSSSSASDDLRDFDSVGVVLLLFSPTLPDGASDGSVKAPSADKRLSKSSGSRHRERRLQSEITLAESYVDVGVFCFQLIFGKH